MLHFLNAADGDIYIVEQDDSQEGPFPWEALFYPFDETVFGKRGYSKIWVKVELDAGAWLKAEVSEDRGPFYQVGLWSNSRKESFTAAVFPGRCDTFQLKLSGEGRCVIKSVLREFDVGSER